MPPRAAYLSLLGVIAWIGLNGCASVPSVPVPEGSRIVIRLYDAVSGIELALANESYPELKDLYSRSRSDASLKRAPDQLIGELLASLNAAGLAIYGSPGRPLTLLGKDSYLFLENDGAETLFLKPSTLAPAEERRAYSHIKLVMSEYYMHVGGAQNVENPDGGDFFRDQR
jgi:hypothetical protein